MKQTYIITLIAVVVLAACGGQPTLEEKKKELSQLKAQGNEIRTQIASLEEEIANWDIPEDTNAVGQQATLVSVIDISQSSFLHRIESRGMVASRKNVMLSAQSNGEIKEIKVSEGQYVKKGQVLMIQDSEILRSSIQELKTSLDLANTLYIKQKRLFIDKGIGTEVQYLQAKNNKESLESKLATANAQLAQTIVRAPFSGSVDEIPIRTGEIAMPGMPLVRLFSATNLYIKAEVSERYIGKFKKGDKVSVDFPSFDESIESVVTAVGQVINSQNRTFSIEVALPKLSFDPKPNMVAVLKLQDYENAAAFAIPTNVIQRDQKGNYVFTIVNENGKSMAQKKHVRTGLSYDGRTEVLDGLTGEEKLVSRGARLIAQGEFVQVTTK